ncbi:MAG: C25 family cysteine peptidase [Anaerolineae bacterium]
MRLNLWGTTSSFEIENDHDFDLKINDQFIDTLIWDGSIEKILEISLPSGILRPGQNEILLDNTPPGAAVVDIMQVNWLEVDYQAPPTAVNDQLLLHPGSGTVTLTQFSAAPLIFDITDPAQPHLSTGWQTEGEKVVVTLSDQTELAAIGPNGFLSTNAIIPLRQSDWRNTENGADFVIVTSDQLAPALAPLVAARQADGLTAVVIPIAEIYDEFGYGEASPDSLRAFYQFALANWQTPPQYTLLVGDATTDYRNYLGKGSANNIPPFMIPVQFGGETVSDSRLVDVDEDGRPDLAIGRWPVSNAADVKALIERTLAYEGGTASPNSLFATDSTEAQFADTAARLQEQSQFAADATHLLDGPTAQEVAGQVNEGVWLATYIGHGSVAQLGKEEVFSNDYVAQINPSQPPIWVQLTCLSGLFAHTELTSLSEEMLLHDSGPVEIIGATSLTLPNDQEPFALNLFKNLQDPAITRIGDAFTRAKQEMEIGGNSGLQEISDTFVLFGDPSARIVRPTP